MHGGACLFIWTARTMHAEALSEAAGNSSSLSLLCGVFWYGSSISIIIYLSLIRGISSVADDENESFSDHGICLANTIYSIARLY